MTDQAILQHRVENGAAYLDKHKPDWLSVIDLSCLDIASACNCVIGQLLSLNSRIIIGPVMTIDFGFVADKEDYPLLTQLWREYIAKRRLAKVPV